MVFWLFTFCILGFVAAVVGFLRLQQGLPVLPRPANRVRRSRVELTSMTRTILIAAVAAVVVAVLTRWPVAGAVAAAVVFLWPKMMRGGARERESVAKVAALAAWIETLRDTAAAQAALETAIPATVADAPKLLAPALRELSQRLARMEPLPLALTHFADAVDDRGADLVVAALALNARQRGGSLRRVLTVLALNTRSELEMRRKVLKDRNALRRQATQVTGLILLLAVGQAVLEPSWVAPYGTPVGQIALGVLAAAFVALSLRMQQLAAVEPQPRFLQTAEKVTQVAEWRARTPNMFEGGHR
jgi:hypothetical protein